MTHWTRLSDGEIAIIDQIFWSTGLSRHVVAQRLGCSKTRANSSMAGLLEQGLLEEVGLQDSTGGRRPELLRLNHGLGVLLAADIGATGIRVAVLSPDMRILAIHAEPAAIGNGPGLVLSRARKLMGELLARCGVQPQQVIGIGVGVPGPVDFGSGQLVNPPLMPGWDSFSVREDLAEDYDAPVFVDNDVNLLAMGELWRLQRTLPNFLVIKVGTGIGCGIVCRGEIYRGANGSAGDVGHICVDPQGPRCHCGNLGCVEAMAAGPAITRAATEAARGGGSETLAAILEREGTITPLQVARASHAGDAAANAIVQRAGSLIGAMLATTVNFFNPSHIFITGGVTRIGPALLASIRQSVYQRSLALSTRHLEIQYAPLAERGGVIGAAALAMHGLIHRSRQGRR